MPLYAYRCPDGHEFEHKGKIDFSDAPEECLYPVDPESVNCRCGKTVTRIISLTAHSFPGAGSWRQGMSSERGGR